jgi:hypothetical protein
MYDTIDQSKNKEMKVYKNVTEALMCQIEDRYEDTGVTKIGNDELYNKSGDQVSRAGYFLVYAYTGSTYYQPETMLSGKFLSKKVATEISVGKGPIHAYKREICRQRSAQMKLSLCIENEVQEWEVEKYLNEGWSEARTGQVIDAGRAYSLGIKI